MKKQGSKIILSVFFIVCYCSSYGQPKVKIYYEAGVVYFSNFAVDSARHLADFITLTVNPRVVIASTHQGALAIESPLSLRTKRNDKNTGHFSVHLPLIVTYSIGAGSGNSGDQTMNKKFGGTAGLGWGYFLQQTESAKEAISPFKEKLRTHGPEIQLGFRTPLAKKLYLFDRENPLDVVLAVKGSYLINLKDRTKDIGILYVLFGFHF